MFNCHCDPDLSGEAISESNSEIASLAMTGRVIKRPLNSFQIGLFSRRVGVVKHNPPTSVMCLSLLFSS
jgi:hypothetical protein